MHWMDTIKKVAADSQAYEHEGILIDMFTASMMLQVFDGLNENNRVIFLECDLIKAVGLGWKLTK
jgi:hypothetical protein